MRARHGARCSAPDPARELAGSKRTVGVVAPAGRSVRVDAHALRVEPCVRALCTAPTGSPWRGCRGCRGLEFAVTLLLLLGALADIRGVLPNAHGALPRSLCSRIGAHSTERASLICAELFNVSAVAPGLLQVVLVDPSASATLECALPPGCVAVLKKRLVTATDITASCGHSCDHSCEGTGRNDLNGSGAHDLTDHPRFVRSHRATPLPGRAGRPLCARCVDQSSN